MTDKTQIRAWVDELVDSSQRRERQCTRYEDGYRQALFDLWLRIEPVAVDPAPDEAAEDGV